MTACAEVHDIGSSNRSRARPLGATTLDGPLGEAARAAAALPAPSECAGCVAPLRTRPVLGRQVSARRDEGIDSPTSARWRPATGSAASTGARRPPPRAYVNLQHAGHSADVVLFLDTFAEAEGTLDTAVRAAARSLPATWRGATDGAGEPRRQLSWLIGSPGTRQLYRILDALFSAR